MQALGSAVESNESYAPYVTMCHAHANEVALFHAKVLKIFHEKKITALWKETLSFFNICTCEYVISFQRFYPLNMKLSLLWRFQLYKLKILIHLPKALWA